MLSSQDETENEDDESLNRESFLHIASRDADSSILYYRDLPFLMDVSMKMSEFGLALEIGESSVLFVILLQLDLVFHGSCNLPLTLDIVLPSK